MANAKQQGAQALIARHSVAAVASNVRKLRGGQTLIDVAAKAQITQSYLSKIERGENVPKLETLIRLAAALDVPPGELLQVAS